jgi:hypothetical protein
MRFNQLVPWVQVLTSLIASITFWALSPERFLTISTWLRSEKIVMIKEMCSGMVRV